MWNRIIQTLECGAYTQRSTIVAGERFCFFFYFPFFTAVAGRQPRREKPHANFHAESGQRRKIIEKIIE